MIRRVALIAALVVITGALVWALFVKLPRRAPAAARTPAAPASPAPAAQTAAVGRKIKAQLFYVSDDGRHLVKMERDVPFGEGTLEQAREILAAQVAPVSEPLVSAIPAGTTVRAVFLTTGGELYADFSREIVTGHSGGSSDELLTVYAIVNALTENLPAITAVQVMVDGKEVDTLAGHVDLRNPLAKNVGWVQ